MRALRHLSVRHKLTVIILATSAAAMLSGAIISVGYETVRSRRALVNDLTAQAEIVGANSAVALAFGDVQTAREVLGGLRARPEIAYACLYKTDGTPFVEYWNPQARIRYTAPPMSSEPRHAFEHGTLVSFQPLQLDKDPVGVICLRADLHVFRTVLAAYAGIVLIVVVGLLLMCLVLASPLQEIVAEPILHLGRVAERVAALEDYSLRARRYGDDEIGMLTDGFNQMLERIQERDQKLRRAYADLQSNDERFRQLADNITQVFWLTDTTKNEMLYVSPAYGKIWRRTCASLYRSPQTWLDAIHPDDRERVRHAALTRQASGEYDEEYRILLPDGSVRWIRDRAFPITNEEGAVYRIAGVAEDITERKHVEGALRTSERKYREFIEEAADGIFLADDEGRLVFVNPAGRALLGYTEEEILQLHICDTYPLEESRLAVERLTEQQAGGTMQFERRLRRKDNSFVIVDVRAKRRVDGRFQAIMRDVTESRRLEQELLEISEQERRRIGQDLHDGLCQQLVITEFSATALEKKLAAQNRPEAATAATIGKLIDEAITQARALARGLYPVGVESEGLALALGELASKVSRLATVRCRLECPHPVHVANPVVGAHLYRITQEAINNALKHAQAAAITIRLVHDDNQVILSIEDDGVGLPASQSRQDSLGLRIMHYRARMIGGTLEVQPRPGGGTSVRCAFRHGATPIGGNHANPQT